MANFSKHFKIIEKIKSFVMKEKNYERAKESDEITKEIASKIQVSSYNLSKSDVKNNVYTPTYKQIMEQLSVTDETIFKSCVYHLEKIANRQKRHKAEIIKVLSEKQKELSLNDNRHHLITESLKKIK
ncbi:MAG: hypothetical protein ACK5N8_03360 [Alphaproteobacteria bacterium]